MANEGRGVKSFGICFKKEVSMGTIFAKIIRGELPCKKVYETPNILAFEDIHPVSPVHILILPKKAYANLQAVPKEELFILAEIAEAAQILAERYEITEGYRLLTNNGEEAGQTVFHLHFHLLGGRRLMGLG